MPVRTDNLMTRTIGAEAVVYDQAAAVAHALSPLATAVLGHCDGRMSTADAASSLSVSVEDVTTAVTTLQALGLVQAAGVTRRSAMTRAGIVGGVVLATSVAAPLAAQAGSANGGGSTGATTSHTLNNAGLVNTTDFALGFGSRGSFTPVTLPYTRASSAIAETPPSGNNPGDGTITGFVQSGSGSDDNTLVLPIFAGTGTGPAFTGFGTVYVPTGKIFLHPGDGSTTATIRFTNTTGAPITVTTSGTATRTDLADGQGNGVVATLLLPTGSPVFQRHVTSTAYGNSVSLAATFALGVGESADLTFDDDGRLADDSTLIEYTVSY